MIPARQSRPSCTLALKLGIRSIDTRRNGLVGRTEWVNLPKQAKFPATVLPQASFPPQPTPIDDGFETTAVGQPPASAHVSEENRGDSIRVTDETAAPRSINPTCFDMPFGAVRMAGW
jgi:hypothetical protein